ncbi:MAG: thioredoxin family protein [Bacilli bacterium]|nr:thioredoxin family protein [Bacilli bacterium]
MKVVKINAVWCSGCLIMNKIWNKILKQYDIETINLDYDMDEEEALSYDPGNILPVFIFFIGDKEVRRIIGEKSEKEMFDVVKEILDEENC